MVRNMSFPYIHTSISSRFYSMIQYTLKLRSSTVKILLYVYFNKYIFNIYINIYIYVYIFIR